MQAAASSDTISKQSSESSQPDHARKEGKRTKLATSHKFKDEISIIGGDWKF